MMRTFNKIFCSDRITVERTFGMAASKLRALLRAIPLKKLTSITLFLSVCFKLHNLCVDEYLCKKFKYSANYIAGRCYPHPILPTTYGEFLSSFPSNSHKRHLEYIDYMISQELPSLDLLQIQKALEERKLIQLSSTQVVIINNI